MKLLEYFYEIVETDSIYPNCSECWTVTEDNTILAIDLKGQVSNYLELFIPDFEDLPRYNPYLDDFPDIPPFPTEPFFIPYKYLKPLMEIELEFDGSFVFRFGTYPLLCLRGTCSGKCKDVSDVDFCCFNKLTCTDGRLDRNCTSSVASNFDWILLDVYDLIRVLSRLDALLVVFEFTPNIDNPELDFNYAYAIKLLDNKISVITDTSKVEALYKEYNTKYPTQDRKIEESISDEDNNFYFTF